MDEMISYPDKKCLSWNRERRRRKARIKRRDKKLCTIYGLYDSSGTLRYIGQTRNILRDRAKHFQKSIERAIRTGNRLSRVELWIKNCYENGKKIEIRPIDENATWDISEIIYIDRARNSGADLLNVLRGGNDTLHALHREAAIHL